MSRFGLNLLSVAFVTFLSSCLSTGKLLALPRAVGFATSGYSILDEHLVSGPLTDFGWATWDTAEQFGGGGYFHTFVGARNPNGWSAYPTFLPSSTVMSREDIALFSDLSFNSSYSSLDLG